MSAQKLLTVLLFCCGQIAHAEIYRWVDENGVTNFSNERPAHWGGRQEERLDNEFVSPTLPAGPAARGSKTVVLFSRANCRSCQQARQYFQSQQIKFAEIDIGLDPEGRKRFEALGGEGLPVILIDGKRMNGFSPQRFDRLYR